MMIDGPAHDPEQTATRDELLAQIIALLHQRIALLSETVRDLVEYLTPPVETMIQMLAAIFDEAHTRVWNAYQQAGAPYGESDAGMWRWLRELREIKRARARADALEQYHRDLARTRATRRRTATKLARARARDE